MMPKPVMPQAMTPQAMMSQFGMPQFGMADATLPQFAGAGAQNPFAFYLVGLDMMRQAMTVQMEMFTRSAALFMPWLPAQPAASAGAAPQPAEWSVTFNPSAPFEAWFAAMQTAMGPMMAAAMPGEAAQKAFRSYRMPSVCV